MEKSEKEIQFSWVADTNDNLPLVTTRLKRKGSSKKLEYVGWGSKPLLSFLSAIGKLTDEQLSQLEVTAVINEYIKARNLLNPVRKKRVVCDEWLFTLFGRKEVARNKIHELLEVHFSENNDDSEEDEEFSNYSDENMDDFTACKRQRANKAPRNPKPEIENLKLKSLPAAINPENIKLIYLKKSLVLDIAKDSESFERKMIGSYVRIKSDPNDFMQKHSHQLLQVTGVKGSGEGVLLQARNSVKDISIPMLSDSDFAEEECEDLCQRLKATSLPMPTVGELEEKAILLHEDITKHWIERELVVLQKLIDRANEKGWRRELFDHLEKKKQLGSPAEQSKLLLQLPKITAELIKPDPTQNSENEFNNNSPKSILGRVKESSTDSEPNQILPPQIGDVPGPKEVVFKSEVTLNLYSYKDGKIKINNGFNSAKKNTSQDDIVRTDIQLNMNSCGVLPPPQKSAEANDDVIFHRPPDLSLSFRELDSSRQTAEANNDVIFHHPPDLSLSLSELDSRRQTTEANDDIIFHQPPDLNLSLTELDSSRQPAVNDGNHQIFMVSSKSGAHIQLATPRANEIALPLPLPASATHNPSTLIPATQILATQNPETAAPVEEFTTPVIELSDDDDDDISEVVVTPSVVTPSVVRPSVLTAKEDTENLVWHYLDPQGVVQGPFSLTALKRWNDCCYFYPGFRVWKTGQTLGKSVSLSDLLSAVFP